MTQMRVMTSNGVTLTYDTEDVEDIEVSVPSEARELPGSDGVMRRELTGYTQLHLHVEFKHGKRPLWVKNTELDGDRVRRELSRAGDILNAALHAEDVPAELASRILDQFLFGNPAGLESA